MLRIPNPNSNMGNFIAVFTAAYARYRGQLVDLDNIVKAIVDANLATSSGYMGDEAIARSRNSDRSLDRLYNQAKMYAELFRTLGWLRSTNNSALKFTFTLLGAQVVAAGRQWKPLLEEVVVGIEYPNHVLSVKGQHRLRPFATIMRTMLACDDCLARDEMIVGPLSALSDLTQADRQEITQRVMGMRESPDHAKRALDSLRKERRIKATTLGNYTRWPIAILRDLAWTQKDKILYQNSKKTFEVHRLTAAGKQKAKSLDEMLDFRVDQVDQLPFAQKRALARHAHFAMMERAGFDIEAVSDQIRQDEEVLSEALKTLGVVGEQAILFSPFQALSVEDTSNIFPTPEAAPSERSVQAAIDGTDVRQSRDHLFVKPRFVVNEAEFDGAEVNALKAELLTLSTIHSSPRQAAKAFADSRRSDVQQQFYPLITNLFQLIGFKCDLSRTAVNSQRWDACVWFKGCAVPIEIKSPTEEEKLSTKAIRQAVENKVILLARGSLRTDPDMCTMVVGYNIPPERGDMSALIDDVYTTFNFKVGVLDLQSLAQLAITSVTDGLSVDAEMLSTLKGFLDV